MRAYSNARYHRTKKLKGRSRRAIECTEYYKQWRINAGQCMDCGFVITRENYYLIDADHRDPSKKRFGLSRAHKYGLAAVIAELEKCDPVCCRCHRIRTFNDAARIGAKGWTTRRNHDKQLKLQLQ
ncbi:MAG: hypothetical protein EBT80_09305 [Chitinophagales bacterium]|nr:hypothetical protein [Chitinophagales bacterium]